MDGAWLDVSLLLRWTTVSNSSSGGGKQQQSSSSSWRKLGPPALAFPPKWLEWLLAAYGWSCCVVSYRIVFFPGRYIVF